MRSTARFIVKRVFIVLLSLMYEDEDDDDMVFVLLFILSISCGITIFLVEVEAVPKLIVT
jgi:hypothetical protein